MKAYVAKSKIQAESFFFKIETNRDGYTDIDYVAGVDASNLFRAHFFNADDVDRFFCDNSYRRLFSGHKKNQVEFVEVTLSF
jgi:hypothetical protein